MKVLLFSDLHIGLNENREVWKDLPILVFNHIHDVVLKQDIKEIFFLGDFFHSRREINSKSINTGIKGIETLNSLNIPVHLICGNHDSYFKNTLEINSLNIFREFKNIKVYDKEEKLSNDISICPYSCSYTSLDSRFLFGHFDIKDFKLNYISESKGGEDPKNFKEYERVFSGHYHHYQEKDNICFVGSPYPQDFGDIGSTKRGYIILDVESGEYTHYSIKESPKFFKVDYPELDRDIIKGNMIKACFNGNISENEIEKFLESISLLEPLEISTDFSNINIEEVQNDEEININLDEKELIFSYLDKINLPDHINKDFCKKVIQSLI